MDNTEQLLQDFKESLERALRDLLGGLTQEMRAGFAQLNAKFDAQDALVRPWRLAEFGEKIDGHREESQARSDSQAAVIVTAWRL